MEYAPTAEQNGDLPLAVSAVELSDATNIRHRAISEFRMTWTLCGSGLLD